MHYEGPFVNSAQCGALRSQYFRSFANHDALDSLPMLNSPAAVHMMTVAPEIEGGIELVRAVETNGVGLFPSDIRARDSTFSTKRLLPARDT